jgi:hypothetical protein
MEEINNNTVFELLKKTPTFINLVKLPNLNKELIFNDIINVWKLFKKTNNIYLDNFCDYSELLNSIFNENINYNLNKKKIIVEDELLEYKSFLDNNLLFNSFLETHCISKNRTMIVISIKGCDNIFINIKDSKIWKENIKYYFKNKNFIKMYKELKKGPFWSYNLDDDRLNKKIIDILWKNQIYTKNCLCYAMFVDQ